MSQDPKIFQRALRYWMNRTLEKAIKRATEKGRPFDPWNVYEGSFISKRLRDEIAEWDQADRTLGPDDQLDELKDIVALATSRAMFLLHLRGFKLKGEK